MSDSSRRQAGRPGEGINNSRKDVRFIDRLLIATGLGATVVEEEAQLLIVN